MAIKIIGLTGPSGAGKSEFCRLIKEKCIPFIDADKVYHSLITRGSACTSALVSEFGTEILDSHGAPDRKKLGEIVFSSKEKLEKLNSLVLHFVIEDMRNTIATLDRAGEHAVVVDAPTLIESGFHLECDTVISVIASKENRISRILERDKITREAAEKRVKSQHPDEFYVAHSDIVITNDSDISAFCKKAEETISKILE